MMMLHNNNNYYYTCNINIKDRNVAVNFNVLPLGYYYTEKSHSACAD